MVGAEAEASVPVADSGVTEEAAERTGHRLWLLPAFMLLLLLAPLLREGLPATQAGLSSLNREIEEAITPSLHVIALLVYRLLPAKLAASLMVGLSIIALAELARSLWGRSVAWWVAALGATVPLLASMLYQLGWLGYLSGLFYLIAGGVLLYGVRVKKKVGWMPLGGILALWGLAQLATWQPGLSLYQLFTPAPPVPTSLREWVANPSYQLGLMPVALALMALLVAWPRRAEPEARRVLALWGVALVGIVVALLGGPVLLAVSVAALALVLAAGGLPVLDRRFASLPVQVGILAIAALNLYPSLQPLWLEPSRTSDDWLFGDKHLWLVDAQVQREGETTTVEALWQATTPPGRDFTAFVHLLDAQGEMLTQADALLIDQDDIPTSGWPQGYLVRQRYEATSAQAPASIRIGLYDRETLQRLPLPLRDNADSITLPAPPDVP